EGLAHDAPIEGIEPGERSYRVLDGIHEEARNAVLDDFRHRPAGPRDHRRAAGHGLDHGETERLRPVDGKEQRPGVAEKSRLVGIADLAEILDIAVRAKHR